MRVYERRPSGLAPSELAAHARARPADAVFAAARLVLGVVGIAFVGAPLGVLWMIAGVALVGSAFRFVGAAGAAAMERPALVLTGTPKWDGVKRTSWRIDADEPLASAQALAGLLDTELGDALTAFDEGPRYQGTTRREAFAPAAPHPVIIAWGVGRKARLAADGDTNGVWMRLEDGAVTLLSDGGSATEALTTAAWRA